MSILNILSIFPASVYQFFANILVFVNINPFLYITDQFALHGINKKSDSVTLAFVSKKDVLGLSD